MNDCDRLTFTLPSERLDPRNELGLPQPPWFAAHMTPLEYAAEQAMLESRKHGQEQADVLLAAGWQFEIVSESGTEPWQWAWRRPPRRAGSQGMRFASTNQAYMALMREHGMT